MISRTLLIIAVELELSRVPTANLATFIGCFIDGPARVNYIMIDSDRIFDTLVRIPRSNYLHWFSRLD